MENIGRDKVEQISNNSTISIDNRSADSKKDWHNNGFGQIIIAVVAGILVLVIWQILSTHS